MVRLEELVVGAKILGIDPQGPVIRVATQWHGDSAMKVVWETAAGSLGKSVLYRENEASLFIQEKVLPWSFDGDAGQLKLVSEAWRIRYAYLFDPYLAVHSSRVDPLPHQIKAVYQQMLERLPLRYVLADDPGAGKTIMTGLFIKELIARGGTWPLSHCLPG